MTTCRMTRLRPHVARSVSSGRVYSRRMMVPSMSDPEGPDDERRGDEHDQHGQPQLGADQHRVGPEHEELAVREVDDAHQAERDHQSQ